jgi:hypothetical protein
MHVLLTYLGRRAGVGCAFHAGLARSIKVRDWAIGADPARIGEARRAERSNWLGEKGDGRVQ